MSIAPDPFDSERSRAAVAVACLRWLECTGPSIEFGIARETLPVANLPRDPSPIARPAHPLDSGDLIHPLWDRWLDG